MGELQDIGSTAGQVWNLLKKQGKASVSAVESGVKAPKRRVHMALGWLAREGKIEMATEGGGLRVWLVGD